MCCYAEWSRNCSFKVEILEVFCLDLRGKKLLKVTIVFVKKQQQTKINKQKSKNKTIGKYY